MNATDSANLATQLEGYTLEVKGVTCGDEDIRTLQEVCGESKFGVRTAIGLTAIYEALQRVVGDPHFPLPFAGIVHVEQSFQWARQDVNLGQFRLSCSMHNIVVRPRMVLFTLHIATTREHDGSAVVNCDARMMCQFSGGEE